MVHVPERESSREPAEEKKQRQNPGRRESTGSRKRNWKPPCCRSWRTRRRTTLLVELVVAVEVDVDVDNERNENAISYREVVVVSLRLK